MQKNEFEWIPYKFIFDCEHQQSCLARFHCDKSSVEIKYK